MCSGTALGVGQMTESEFAADIAVIGGCGHVGLPLAIAFADRGARVVIFDVSEEAAATVNAGQLPFDEPGAGRGRRPAARLDRRGGSPHSGARGGGDRDPGRRAPEPEPPSDTKGPGR